VTAARDDYRDFVDLYDIFVDWPNRLSREMPGLTRRLRDAGAKRVLDIGCGTGRHLRALGDAGFEAFGADSDTTMIDRAGRIVDPSRLAQWSLGEPLPDALKRLAPLDAIVCLGNVWPHVVDDASVERAIDAMADLLRSGGALIVGFKALAVQREAGRPYMPLLKRTHEGRPMFFVRFIDFDVPADAGVDVGRMHMTVVAGDSKDEASIERHEIRTLRVWSVDQLRAAFGRRFDTVHVSGQIGDPTEPATSENVFVHAVRR